jgi:G3E family GTPase
MEMKAELHSIIAIISVIRYESLEKEDIFQKQVIYANKVLLTFIDKTSNEKAEEVWKMIKKYNRECCIAK